MRNLICIVFALLAFTACQAPAGPPREENKPVGVASSRKVEVRKTASGFQLYRNGKPFYIRGASGGQQLEWVKRAGGNAVRVYDTNGLDSLLEQAQSLGLGVMVDLYVGRAMEGFDYRDVAAVEAQKIRIRETVLRYKDHPALLLWAVGNEPDNATKDVDLLWPAMNDLIRLIHALDPDHPVTIPIYSGSLKRVLRDCPDIDIISINTFSRLAEFTASYDVDKPYIISEYGVNGPWEIGASTYWMALSEPGIKEKCRMIRDRYQGIAKDSSHCLGSFVFFWGQKQEYTSSWFSFFTEAGDKTPLVDLMADLWGKQAIKNRAPQIKQISVLGVAKDWHNQLHTGKTYSFSLDATDPENDPLVYHWEIVPDGPFEAFPPGASKYEIKAPALDMEIRGNGTERVQFTVPDIPGPYRIYVQVSDGQGSGACTNIPVFILNERLTVD